MFDEWRSEVAEVDDLVQKLNKRLANLQQEGAMVQVSVVRQVVIEPLVTKGVGVDVFAPILPPGANLEDEKEQRLLSMVKR